MAFFHSTIQNIEQEVADHSNRNWWGRLFHAKYDREKVQGWKLDFQKTLGIFSVRCVVRLTQSMISEGPFR